MEAIPDWFTNAHHYRCLDRDLSRVVAPTVELLLWRRFVQLRPDLRLHLGNRIAFAKPRNRAAAGEVRSTASSGKPLTSPALRLDHTTPRGLRWQHVASRCLKIAGAAS